MTEDNSIIEQLEVISLEFELQLPEKGVEISAQWSAINKDILDVAAIEALYGLTHKLAGAGGIFGFNRITDLAREITESLRVALNETKTGLSTTERARLEGPIKRLVELCMNPIPDTEN